MYSFLSSFAKRLRPQRRSRKSVTPGQPAEILEVRQLLSATSASSVEQQAYDLDQELELSFKGKYWENHAQLGEKWMKSDVQDAWYYITPDGGVYDHPSQTLVLQLTPEYYADPSLLHDAVNPSIEQDMAPAATAWEVDSRLQLSFAGSYWEDYLGAGEKWMKSDAENSWYYILPNGTVMSHSAGNAVARLTPEYHEKPELLHDARNPGEPVRDSAEVAEDLDERLDLQFEGQYWFDHRGLQEKWMKSHAENAWVYILPDGTVVNGKSGDRIATLTSEYHTDPALLHEAHFVNQPPVFEAVQPLDLTEGDVSTQTIGFSDADGDDVAITWTGLPEFAEVLQGDDGQYLLHVTPVAGDAGTHTIAFTATDSHGAETTIEVEVSVSARPNTAPIISYLNDVSAVAGEIIAAEFQITDAESDDVTVRYENLPSFVTVESHHDGWYDISVDADSGDAGVYAVTVTATDDHGAESSSTFEIHVATRTNSRPIIEQISAQRVAAGTTINGIISGYDADGDHLTFTIDGKPVFATFQDTGLGFALMSIAPPRNAAGTWSITVTATDLHGASDSTVIALTVVPINVEPPVTPDPPQSVYISNGGGTGIAAGGRPDAGSNGNSSVGRPAVPGQSNFHIPMTSHETRAADLETALSYVTGGNSNDEKIFRRQQFHRYGSVDRGTEATELRYLREHADGRKDARMMQGRTLVISGSDNGDNIRLTTSANGQQIVVQNHGREVGRVDRNRVSNVLFLGNGGHDTFDATEMTIPIFAFGGSGQDTLKGGSNSDYLFGGTERDIINGNGGHDWIEGNGGWDTLHGGSGKDWLFGGASRDTIYASAPGEDERDWNWIDGGSGNDELHGSSGSDYMLGGSGVDELQGHDGNDILSGGIGDDGGINGGLVGGSGRDLLSGDSGNDSLDGGSGEQSGAADWLFGGSGRDYSNSRSRVDYINGIEDLAKPVN